MRGVCGLSFQQLVLDEGCGHFLPGFQFWIGWGAEVSADIVTQKVQRSSVRMQAGVPRDGP